MCLKQINDDDDDDEHFRRGLTGCSVGSRACRSSQGAVSAGDATLGELHLRNVRRTHSRRLQLYSLHRTTVRVRLICAVLSAQLAPPVRYTSCTQLTGSYPLQLKLLRSTDLFRRHLKTFLFHSVYGHQDTD